MAYNSDIRRWVRSKEWDAFLFEGYNSLTNIYAMIYAFIHRIPVILGVDIIENGRYKILKSILYKMVSAFWVPGKRSTDYLVSEGVPREKIFQGKYTYDLKEIKEKTDSINQITVRKILDIDKTDIVLLFVGKLIPTRNISLLLKVLQSIKNDKLKLIVIGNGPEESIVRKCTDKRLRYIPCVSLMDLYKYFAISDIYVHPGSEPYSLAVVQAVASDIFVVSSKAVGAVDDVITEGKNGYTFENGSYQGLLKGILMAIEKKKDLYTTIHEQGEKVRNERSVEFSSDELVRAISYVKRRKYK